MFIFLITFYHFGKKYAMIILRLYGGIILNREIKFLFDVFICFLKIGPVTFGGGYAMIPLIEREVVTRKKWLEIEDVTDVFALAESVPGAIAINSATFIGHRLAGVKGAICAMLGILLPTFCTTLILGVLLFSFQGNPHVESAFMGIRPTIVALIVYAGIKISRAAILDKTTFGLMLAMLTIILILDLHPIIAILSGAFLGISIVKIKEKIGYAVKFNGDIKKQTSELSKEGAS